MEWKTFFKWTGIVLLFVLVGAFVALWIVGSKTAAAVPKKPLARTPLPNLPADKQVVNGFVVKENTFPPLTGNAGIKKSNGDLTTAEKQEEVLI